MRNSSPRQIVVDLSSNVRELVGSRAHEKNDDPETEKAQEKNR